MATSLEIRQQFLDFFKSKGHEIVPADGVPGSFRVHVSDPFGNRIELMEPL